MLQAPGKPHLVHPQVLDALLLLGRALDRAHYLERDLALVETIGGEVHLGHSALAQLPDVFESAPQCAGECLGDSHGDGRAPAGLVLWFESYALVEAHVVNLPPT